MDGELDIGRIVDRLLKEIANRQAFEDGRMAGVAELYERIRNEAKRLGSSIPDGDTTEEKSDNT